MVQHVFIYIASTGRLVRMSVRMVGSDFTILKHRTPRKLHSFKIIFSCHVERLRWKGRKVGKKEKERFRRKVEMRGKEGSLIGS